jgi:hypothetical protein
LEVKLSSDELAERGMELNRVLRKLKTLENQFEKQKADHKADVKEVENDITRLMDSLNSRTEKQTIECVEEWDYANRRVRVIRSDTKEIVSERAMAESEAQRDITEVLPEVETPPVPPAVETPPDEPVDATYPVFEKLPVDWDSSQEMPDPVNAIKLSEMPVGSFLHFEYPPADAAAAAAEGKEPSLSNTSIVYKTVSSPAVIEGHVVVQCEDKDEQQFDLNLTERHEIDGVPKAAVDFLVRITFPNENFALVSPPQPPAAPPQEEPTPPPDNEPEPEDLFAGDIEQWKTRVPAGTTVLLKTSDDDPGKWSTTDGDPYWADGRIVVMIRETKQAAPVSQIAEFTPAEATTASPKKPKKSKQ